MTLVLYSRLPQAAERNSKAGSGGVSEKRLWDYEQCDIQHVYKFFFLFMFFLKLYSSFLGVKCELVLSNNFTEENNANHKNGFHRRNFGWISIGGLLIKQSTVT